MRRVGAKARLYLDGKDVGCITTRRWENSWGFGQFQPSEAFAPYAPYYGQWSLLMHADQGNEPLSREAASELRAIEARLDAIRARLHYPDDDQWVDLVQLNIDGGLVEWKEH